MPNQTSRHFASHFYWMFLLGILAFASSPSTAMPPHEQGTLALVGPQGGFLWQLGQPGQPLATPISAAPGASAVAADPVRALFWIMGTESLSLHSVDGSVLLGVDLAGPDFDPKTVEGEARHLVVLPTDGSLWAGVGDHLWNVAPGGQILQHLRSKDPMVGMELDSTSGELWVASASGAVARDAITGEVQLTFVVTGTDAVAALALVEVEAPTEEIEDGEEDETSTIETEVWLIAGDRLLRHGPDGSLRNERVLGLEEPVTAATSDGNSGAWFATGTELGRYRLAQDDVQLQSPFQPEADLTALQYDASHRAVWLAGNDELIRVGLSGWALGRKERVGVPVTGVAVIVSSVDDVPPELAIIEPAEGETVEVPQPPLRFEYSDEGSGVLNGTLALLANGAALNAACTYTPDEAVCTPASDLPEGEIILEATVEDAVGNPSPSATQTFTVSLSGGGAGGGMDPANIYTPAATPRGIRPNQPYQFGEIDAIDAASGNVTFRVPLGQVFEVGPFLRYQFLAVNNSNAWDYIQVPCQGSDPNCTSDPLFLPSTIALPNAGSNAGLGWEVHFGKLYAFSHPTGLDNDNQDRWPNSNLEATTDFDTRWLYVAPDGSRHTLHSLPDRANGSTSLPIRYSKDSSFLRMQQTSATEARVEFPNGTYSVFERVGGVFTGTDFCGPGISGCWRFKEMKDRYENRMWIEYNPPTTGSTESWVVKDSTGRESVIRFDISDSATGGGDGTGTFRTQDGDEWGDLRRVVTSVQVAKFNSGTANYDFTYVNATVGRSCPPNTDGFLVEDETIDTRILTEISVPESQPYKFTTNTSPQTTCPDTRGRITEVTLPTRGRITYSYGNSWEFPTTCNYGPGADTSAETFYVGPGIVSKVREKPDGTAEGTWSYSTDLFPVASTLVGGGANCTRADYRLTTVDGPTFDGGKFVRTESYHAVHQGPRIPSSGASGTSWQVTDQGLPYAKDFDDGGTGLDKLFLSSVTSFCANAACDGADSEETSKTYRRYVSEYRSCNKFDGQGDSAGCFQVNALQRAERTVYPTDGNRYVWTTGTDYDGVGHFRVQTMEDFFDGTSTRSTTTNYTATDQTLTMNSTSGYVNVGTPSTYLPLASDPWILTPYDKITKVGDGRTYVTDVEFNDKGSVICSRTRKASGEVVPSRRTGSAGF